MTVAIRLYNFFIHTVPLVMRPSRSYNLAIYAEYIPPSQAIELTYSYKPLTHTTISFTQPFHTKKSS